MNQRYRYSILLLIITVVITAIGVYYLLPIFAYAQLGDLGEPRSSYDLGSSSILEGRCLIISFYVDTPESSWSTAEIDATIDDMHIACEYLEDAAAKYGSQVEMIYDWSRGGDLRRLYHRAKIPFVTDESEESEDRLDEYIARWVTYLPSYEKLMEVYGANNVFMIVFFNHDGRSYAISLDGIDSWNESLIAYTDANPAVLAHEMLHLFGAHDYYEGAEYTEDVVLYIKEKYPNEIMLKTKYQNGRISSEVSPLTAYHLGWTDSAEEVEKFKQLTR